MCIYIYNYFNIYIYIYIYIYICVSIYILYLYYVYIYIKLWEEDDAKQLYLVLKVSCRWSDNLSTIIKKFTV